MNNVQYSRVPTREDDEGDDIFNPTLTERLRDTLSKRTKSCLVPVLATTMLIVVVVLIILFSVPTNDIPKRGPDFSSPIFAPPAGKPAWDNIRLPEHITPNHYDLDFVTILDGQKNSHFYGDASIEVEIHQDTDFIVLHSLDLNITDFSVDTEKGELKPIRQEANSEKQFQIFVFDHVLVAKQYIIRMKYAGRLTNGLRGYYLSQYKDSKNREKYLAVTQFEATDARRAFPCFDEPAMKATFKIAMTVQEQYHALSNMPVSNIEAPLAQGMKKFVFEETKRMSTYLVAFIVSDFESIHGRTTRGIKVGVYTRPGQTKLGEYALSSAINIIDHYEELFGIPYPLPKSDLFAVPDFSAGAMENWGLITYRDTALLYDPEISSAANKQRVTTVIAHELGHQWFGNYVTMDWWDSLWLNEGFATFCEYLGTNATEPYYNVIDQFFIEDTVKSLVADSSTRTHPIHVDVKSPAEIQDIFDEISYSKGAASIKMLQNYIEERRPFVNNRSPFFVGLQKYLESHAYANAKTLDLWSALDDSDLKVADFMKTWTEQPGYPLIKFSESYNRSIFVSQSRFFSSPFANATSNNQTWLVPLSYAVYNNASGFPTLVTTKSTLLPASNISVEISLPDSAAGVKTVLKANVNQNSFYRSQLPEHMITTFGHWLFKYPQFMAPLDRAGIIEDTFALFKSGKLNNPLIALELTKFLLKEDDYVVWSTALDRLSGLEHIFCQEPDYSAVKKYMRDLIDPIVRNIDWEEKSDDPTQWHVRALLRAKILSWAVRIGHKTTVRNAQRYFQDIRKKKAVDLPTDVLAVVFDGGVRYGDDSDYDFVLSLYLKSEFATESLRYLHALAQAPKLDLIHKNLKLSLSGKIRSQDFSGFITQIAAANAAGLLSTWNFIRENWEPLMKMFGDGGTFSKMNSVLTSIVGRFTSSSMVQEAEKMLHDPEHFKLPPKGDDALEKGLDSANVSIWWLKSYGAIVQQWFKTQTGDKSITI